MREKNKRPPRQHELWDDTQLSLRLMKALALVILGEEGEHREGISILLDVARSDVRMAKRLLAILDANPKMKSEYPDLYDMCFEQVRPGLTSTHRH